VRKSSVPAASNLGVRNAAPRDISFMHVGIAPERGGNARASTSVKKGIEG